MPRTSHGTLWQTFAHSLSMQCYAISRCPLTSCKGVARYKPIFSAAIFSQGCHSFSHTQNWCQWNYRISWKVETNHGWLFRMSPCFTLQKMWYIPIIYRWNPKFTPESNNTKWTCIKVSNFYILCIVFIPSHSTSFRWKWEASKEEIEPCATGNKGRLHERNSHGYSNQGIWMGGRC